MRPFWIKLVIVASCLPLAAYPWMLSRVPQDGSLDTLLALLPLYILGSAICQWRCWPVRRELTWILLAVQWLMYIVLLLYAIMI